MASILTSKSSPIKFPSPLPPLLGLIGPVAAASAPAFGFGKLPSTSIEYGKTPTENLDSPSDAGSSCHPTTCSCMAEKEI